MAQLVLGVAGAVIGGMFGMPSVGWAIGSAVGSAFAPTQKSHGPKLSDLKVTASEYGGALHILEGHPRVSGVVAWSSDKHEIATTTEQGKGGGAESTSYTYECDCFMLLSDAEILGIRRIWSNGKLIWSIADDSDEETIEASEETTKWKAMRMYSGAADQLPDPVYESAVGLGNAPAYRGRGGVFFEGLSLGSGGVMPNLTFEVNAKTSENDTVTARILEQWAETDVPLGPPHGAVTAGDASGVKLTTMRKNRLVTYSQNAPKVDADPPENGSIADPGSGGGDRAVMVFGMRGLGEGAVTGYVVAGDGLNQTVYLPAEFERDQLGALTIRFSIKSGHIAVGSSAALVGSGEWGNRGRVFVHTLAGVYVGYVETGTPINSLALGVSVLWVLGDGGSAVRAFQMGAGLFEELPPIPLPEGLSAPAIFISESGVLHVAGNNADIYRYTSPAMPEEGEEPAPSWVLHKHMEYPGPPAVDLGTALARHFTKPNGDQFAIISTQNNQPMPPEDFEYYVDSFHRHVPRASIEDCILPSHIQYGWTLDFDDRHLKIRNCRRIVEFIEEYEPWHFPIPPNFPGGRAYIKALYSVKIFSDRWENDYYGWLGPYGLTFSVELIHEEVGTEITKHHHAVYRAPIDLTGTLVDANLQDVVERLCYRAGLKPADVDATALAGDWVHAFAIPPGAAKGALDQLAAAYYFECVESDKLYFRKRGRPTSLTIPYDDLGAEALLAVQDANDLEIPAQVFVKYMNLDDSYQSGSEVSDRLTTDSTAVNNMELALGFTPAQAKGIADTACLDQNIGSRSLSFALDRRYSELEPTDVVGVQDGFGSTFRARIVKISDASGVRNIEAVADDASVLSATGITSNNYTPDYTVRPVALTDLVVLDMPILRDVDDGPGLYTAGDGLAGTWPGYVLLIEGLQVGTSTTGAAMGAALDVLGNWTGGLVDEMNSVTVQLNPGDQLASITHDQLTSSIRNYAAIGAHGRWELLQYRSAELIGPGLYRLRGLLRGQLGTEHLTSAHAVGDRFVQLDGAGMLRPAASIADVMTSRHYQGVTMGALVSSAPVQTITNHGVGMRPYAPVNLRQTHSGADIVMAWDRRTRYQTNLLTDVVPLGESSESYQADIYNGTSVVRTITTSTPTLTYTSAQQIADFGSTQAAVDVRVYQISASVGRGTPLIYEA